MGTDTTTRDDLAVLLLALGDARAELAEREEEVAAIERMHEELYAARKEAREHLAEIEASVREAAVAEYEEAVKADPNAPKKLGDGAVTIRESVELDYRDSDAIRWADTNAPFLVKREAVLDAARFKTVAVDMGLPFVTTHKTYKAAIARVLPGVE